MPENPLPAQPLTTPVPPSQARPPGGASRGGSYVRGATLVAAGIFLSRIMGLVRERVFAHYLGNSLEAGVFKAALRIPNFPQSLLGEGVLSASFIPVYAGLLGKGEHEEADRVAGGVFGLLALATALLTAGGMLGTALLVDIITPGLDGAMRELAIRLVRILFPGVACMVMSAWCLGVLNSHRRFFLGYAAPVLWSLALIVTMVAVGGRKDADELVVALAWGSVAGGLLQFAVQLPAVLRLLGRLRPTLTLKEVGVRRVVNSFGPVVLGRGVVQFSAYVDTALASLVSAAALAPFTYAQTLYMLPVSLFGMSVSAAELPEMARAGTGSDEARAKVRERLRGGRLRITFLVVPSAVAFLLLGDVVAAAVLQTGHFGPADARLTWYLLMGAAVGLVASTLGRLYSSALYAIGDAKSPLRFAVVRVTSGAGLAAALVLGNPLRLPGLAPTAFLPLASGAAAWVEFQLLRRTLRGRIGPVDAGGRRTVRLWAAAVLAGSGALAVKMLLVQLTGIARGLEQAWGGRVLPAPALHPILAAVVILGTYGVLYFALAHLLGIREAAGIAGRVVRRQQFLAPSRQ